MKRKLCRHAIKNLKEIRRFKSSTHEDMKRQRVAAICLKCFVLKLGHENSQGKFTLERAVYITQERAKELISISPAQARAAYLAKFTFIC